MRIDWDVPIKMEDGIVLRANGICKIARADDPRFQMKDGKRFSFDTEGD